jgi:dethiobiotin synthetase
VTQRRACFVAGTDTDVGKTVVAAGILRAASRQGLSTLALKPVAAGCTWQAGRLVNADALALIAEATASLEYADVNPVALEPAIAPHLAAADAGVALSLDTLAAHCRAQLLAQVDLAVVEGAGGWLVPLNDSETLADLCQALALPVVLVVGMRLGCLNHALLTAADLAHRGVPLAGWVANDVDREMAERDANFATLERLLEAPCLAHVPFAAAGDAVEVCAKQMDLAPLLAGAWT